MPYGMAHICHLCICSFMASCHRAWHTSAICAYVLSWHHAIWHGIHLPSSMHMLSHGIMPNGMSYICHMCICSLMESCHMAWHTCSLVASWLMACHTLPYMHMPCHHGIMPNGMTYILPYVHMLSWNHAIWHGIHALSWHRGLWHGIHLPSMHVQAWHTSAAICACALSWQIMCIDHMMMPHGIMPSGMHRIYVCVVSCPDMRHGTPSHGIMPHGMHRIYVYACFLMFSRSIVPWHEPNLRICHLHGIMPYGSIHLPSHGIMPYGIDHIHPFAIS
jgi:hypothetical protein